MSPSLSFPTVETLGNMYQMTLSKVRVLGQREVKYYILTLSLWVSFGTIFWVNYLCLPVKSQRGDFPCFSSL